MKITLVISTLNPGGAERVMTTLANAWAEKQAEVIFVTFKEPGYQSFYPLHPRVTLCNLNLLPQGQESLLSKLGNRVKRLFALRRTIKQQKPELVISFMDTVNITTLLATIGLGIPVIISERIDPRYFQIGFFNKLLRKITYPFAKHIVVQTGQILNYFPSTLHPRISIIPNPVSIPPKATDQNRIDFEKKQIIAVGRLLKQKGFDLLLQAFSKINLKFPDWKLVIWGEGNDRSALETLSNQLKLSTQVSFPGVTDDIYSELSQSSLFVLSSRFEGFPNALCEAMAIGLPVIAFDCGSGPSDIVRHQIDGLLIPADNIEALSKTMKQLMENAALRKQFGNRASEITDRFSVKKILGEWDKLIESCSRL